MILILAITNWTTLKFIQCILHLETLDQDFWGASIDTAAQKTVIGKQQVEAYLCQVNENAKV